MKKEEIMKLIREALAEEKLEKIRLVIPEAKHPLEDIPYSRIKYEGG